MEAAGEGPPALPGSGTPARSKRECIKTGGDGGKWGANRGLGDMRGVVRDPRLRHRVEAEKKVAGGEPSDVLSGGRSSSKVAGKGCVGAMAI